MFDAPSPPALRQTRHGGIRSKPRSTLFPDPFRAILGTVVPREESRPVRSPKWTPCSEGRRKLSRTRPDRPSALFPDSGPGSRGHVQGSRSFLRRPPDSGSQPPDSKACGHREEEPALSPHDRGAASTAPDAGANRPPPLLSIPAILPPKPAASPRHPDNAVPVGSASNCWFASPGGRSRWWMESTVPRPCD